VELYVTQELNKWGNLYGEKLTLEHFLNHPQRMVYVVFTCTLWSCNKPNMVRLSQAFRQIAPSLVEKPDETLGLPLVVSFLK